MPRLGFGFLFLIFTYLAAAGLICGMGDLVPQPGIDPGLLALGGCSCKPLDCQGSLNLHVILQVYVELPDGRRSFEQLP